MDYREYYKQVSALAEQKMHSVGKKKDDEPKGFVAKPSKKEEKPEETAMDIVAEYMAFFRKDAVEGLKEAGVDADFVDGKVMKMSKEVEEDEEEETVDVEDAI